MVEQHTGTNIQGNSWSRTDQYMVAESWKHLETSPKLFSFTAEFRIWLNSPKYFCFDPHQSHNIKTPIFRHLPPWWKVFLAQYFFSNWRNTFSNWRNTFFFIGTIPGHSRANLISTVTFHSLTGKPSHHCSALDSLGYSIESIGYSVGSLVYPLKSLQILSVMLV